MICKHSVNNIFQQALAYFSSRPNDFKYFHPIQIILSTSNHTFAQSNSLEHCYAPATIQHQSFVCPHLNKYTGYVRD